MASRQKPVPEVEHQETKLPRWPVMLRWSLALLLFCAMGAGAVLGSAKLMDPQTLPLKVVRIEGEFKHLDRRELEQVVAGEVRAGFFTVDVEAIRVAAKRLPWVDEVSVRRVWPDTLQIWVEEQVPLARWGERQLVNPRGEVFTPDVDEIPSGLPRLEGPAGTGPEMVVSYRAMQIGLEAIGLSISRLQQDARRAWSVEFTDSTAIRLGSRDTGQRLARFIRLYPRLKAAGRGRPKQVDLRYTNGFVVHWELDEASEKSAWSVTEKINSSELG